MPETLAAFTGYRDIKAKIHSQILEEMDLESLDKLEEELARSRVGDAIRDLLHRDRTPLTHNERERMTGEILNEVFGLGPIEPLLADDTVSDILVNGPDRIYVEREGVLERTNLFFNDAQHLMRIIERIVSRVGRRVDESSPMVDARLMDGSRVNAVVPPLALDGPTLSIRRSSGQRMTAPMLLGNETLTAPMLALLEACVKGKLNVIVSGGTGSGKTTLLNVLSAYIPDSERIITIEDAAELRLNQQHVVRLETRPPNIEGKGAVRQRQLVINALRMRPDRIIVGEVRGEEAVDMLQAMNTGHEGSLTTIHANSARDALSRLETLIAMADLDLPERAVRQQISSAIQVLVQIARFPDGQRKVVSISEVTGLEGSVVTAQELFVFERSGYDEHRRVRGRFRATGIRPRFMERLDSYGVRLDAGVFQDDAWRGGH
jgi:pilus assembly protein CpaF